ncbi:D-2-hydroxyacid dehydrogenase [uncultured Ilyobacter sp.]|uniref:D-2-hydroxyacid dehydrogenase n=1 Tax=uncultured Ilyobacter sp. TaxID=544433 RepID=UPI0029C918A9|nr:D-2-hydroxyacid dehydrogenase [uncultured Ilyobacter sp.]
MKIVLLDAITLGDADISIIGGEGEFTAYEMTSPCEVADRIKDAVIVVTNKVYLGIDEMVSAEKLKLIAVTATGYNNVDIEEAKKRGIKVANVKDYSTESVAQYTIACMMSLMMNLNRYDRAVKAGEWEASSTFTLLKYPVTEMNGKTLGIVGYGAIGKRVGEMAEALGMKVIVAKRPNVTYDDPKRMDFQEVLRTVDVLCIHCPLSDETRNLISHEELDMMKKKSFIINPARGGIIDEIALADALKKEKIGGAALDVLETEPPKGGSPLFSLDNVLITPHIAWSTFESRTRLLEGVKKNIKDFKSGILKGIGE